jgi:hypothetical protein
MAIISDVHADAETLPDAPRAIEALGCDEVVCAGDVVGYGTEPDEVIALLRANGVHTVRAIMTGGSSPTCSLAVLRLKTRDSTTHGASSS